MSLDSSLKTAGNLAGKRSVLKRNERMERFLETKKYDPKAKGVLGMPKTKIVEK
jgi:small basic protein (TIGR04137 family)